VTAVSSVEGSGPRDEADTEPDPRRWKALAVCLLGGFMVLLDVSIVNVALPSIRTGIHASQSELQWVVSGYALTFGLMLVPAGRFGDLRGRRTVFVAALALFIASSAVCGAAPTSLVLVIGRLVQGAAGGSLTPQISALIQQMFRGRERGTAFGWFGSMVGIATAIGPLLGGVLIQLFGPHEGWRAVFYVNVPVGLVAIPLAWRLLPPPDESGHRRRHDFDPAGVLLLGTACVVVLLPFVEDREWGSEKWWLLLVAAALTTAFVFWERHYQGRGREPVVDLALFRRRSYAYGTSMITIYFAAFTPLFFIYTLFVQIGLHYTALQSGLAITPFAIGSALSAAISGRVVYRFGRPLVAAGLVLVGAGILGTVLAVQLVPQDGTGWATLLPLLVAGVGGGFVIPPNQTLTLSEVPVSQAGTAGGLLQTGQRIGTAVGIAAVGSVFFAAVGRGGPDSFASAFERAALVCVAFVAAALVVALVDIALGRRLPERHTDRSATPSRAG
jgi:EmrB/QacA subfamily drug resistance transporter